MDGLGSNGISPANLLGQTGDAVRGWNDCWLDFFDMISEGVFMPLGGLLMTIMIGWELGPDLVKRECEATPGHKMSTYGFFKICVKIHHAAVHGSDPLRSDQELLLLIFRAPACPHGQFPELRKGRNREIPGLSAYILCICCLS